MASNVRDYKPQIISPDDDKQSDAYSTNTLEAAVSSSQS